MMTPAVAFLSGEDNPQGLTVSWILRASNEDLDRSHDWVQWAFPTAKPSSFIPGGPVVSAADLRGMPLAPRMHLLDLLDRYTRFLQETTRWRQEGNHNRLRITRVITCLVLAGLDAHARDFFNLAVSLGSPSTVTLCYWHDALDGVC